ncbi:uncharacterized protein LOC111888554 [Lactuca sativa]|uniref:uncharacterized protein LOC111888554 n=1 Tax=Lactuca sativa TaxID=4236 RepID=UPI000CD88D73|nr:uncharacterized protein LOC111888554 [Lactuca sativa]
MAKKGRRSMETEKVDEAKEELQPRVSDVYIRSLVKHLTTNDGGGGGGGSPENEKHFSEINNNTQKPQKPKKQVRRRLHTTRPYQERLLNMAEARREIVAALKFHRASMKQQEAAGGAVTNHHQPPPVQEKKPKSRRILSLYPSTTTDGGAATATTTAANLYWPISATAPPLPPAYHDNLNLFLPSQTLGLNLNFQNFENLDTRFYHTPLSSSSTSSNPVAGKRKETPENSSGGLHHAMGDEEMEEIRSLGEKHQIEWNDTINLMTSARWCSFLKNMEMEEDEGDEFYGFDQVMKFPPWLINGNENSCLQDLNFSDAYMQDPPLPCMDIGEIEGIDGEWLA